MLSPALGYAQKCARVGDFDSPLRVRKAWADLCPALASWVCKLYDGLLLAESSAKPMAVPWIYPVPPPATTCKIPLFWISASPLYTEVRLLQHILRREILYSCVLPREKAHSLNIKADLLHEKKNAMCILALCFYHFLIKRESILLQQQLPSQLLCPSHPQGGGSMSPGCGHIVWGEWELF